MLSKPLNKPERLAYLNERLAKAGNFLAGISVRCDDESLIDSVIDESGEVSLPKAAQSAQKGDGITFWRRGLQVPVLFVLDRLKTFDTCYENIKKLEEGQ